MGGATILTVGHSNGGYEGFLGLLDGHAIDVVVDVRSSPASRFAPHFSGEQLRRALSLTTHRATASATSPTDRPMLGWTGWTRCSM